MRSSLAILVLLCGCIVSPPRPVDPVAPQPPPAAASRAELCGAIAAQIDARNIETTDELVRVLRLLQDSGNWTAADSAAVDAAIPDLVTKNRPLSPDDSARIKAVK